MSSLPKNGTDDQNDQSISSSSTSSAKSSSFGDGEKKNRTLKSLLKKKIDPNQDFIKSHNKRVKFSETMQVFCYELPDNQMPKIIALKSPADKSLMEFQTYMFEPPAEYQDFLTFEPPPDYRDFIANSLNVFRNEVTFDYIDDDGDDDSEFANESPGKNSFSKDKHISSVVITNDQGQNSKWKSMILGNNLDSLEEEQIIGVLKEDEILQAIGSQISLPVSAEPNRSMNGQKAVNEDVNSKTYTFEVVDNHGHYEENLSSEDFPVHHLNSYMLDSSVHMEDDDEEACCVDSSPNGSFQDLASDSSITSQDTIILINQNKTFHLESVNHTTIPNDSKTESMAENIYENLQSCNSEISVISAATHPVNGDTKSDSNSFDCSESSFDESEISKGKPDEVLYENTSDLLNDAASSVSNQVKNFENRLSISSSEDSKTDDAEVNNCTTNTVNENNSSKFKQNILFYESIMQQNINNKNVLLSHKQATGESGQNSVTSVQLQTGNYPINCNELNHVLVSGSDIPLHLPLYTIIDSNNRASSSSSLSSTSSSSSSITSSISTTLTSQTITSNTSSSLASLSFTNSIIPPQLSPGTASSTSSSSNSSNVAHNDYIQFSAKGQHILPTKRISSLAELNIQANNSTSNSNKIINFVSSNPSHSESSTSMLPNNTSATSPIIQRMGGPPNQVPNENVVRPSQVVYRYPYAFIQQPGVNGISTLRPLQYVVQASPNSGAQSVIYNPRFIINNQTTFNVQNGASIDLINQSLPSQSATPRPTNPQQQPHQTQTMLASSSNEASSTTIPVRRIIVPQGTTVLAPRIMHFHPHQKQNPPPYQYYVQQRQQLFAYQPNVPISQSQTQFSNIQMQNQAHTEFPNPSEIRRRDGLYAYPQVLLKNEDSKNSSLNVKSRNSDQSTEEKDELEEFVQQEQQRTERIKKRYSFTEDDDPTFGFARRPSVRGIRPKFGTSTEIIQQMTSTLAKPATHQKIIMTHSNMTPHSQSINTIFVEKPTITSYGTLPKNAQFIQLNSTGVNSSHPQMISIVKQVNDIHLNESSSQNAQIKSQTLPRQMPNPTQKPTELTHEIVRIIDASMINGPNSVMNTATLSRDQLKLHLQKQLERQQMQQKMMSQRINAQNVAQNSSTAKASTVDERGVPEGSSFSPNHLVPGNDSSSFSSIVTTNVKDVNNPLVNDNNKANSNDVVYYSLNV